MCFHPAYPTTAELSREHNAALRDLEDLQTLDALRRIVAHAVATTTPTIAKPCPRH
jgi:hypothetical protein